MASADVSAMTVDQFLSLPEDGSDRELIEGELRERPMAVRDFVHSRLLMRLGMFLSIWRDSQPTPRGHIVGGEAGFRLRTDADSVVGIDIAYVSHELTLLDRGRSRILYGTPILAVEILSPSDQNEDIVEKVHLYLKAGVTLVWVVDPGFKTITAHQNDTHPRLFTTADILKADALPGFNVAVAEIFSED